MLRETGPRATNEEYLWKKANYVSCPICHSTHFTFETYDVDPILYRCLNILDPRHRGLNSVPFGWYGDI